MSLHIQAALFAAAIAAAVSTNDFAALIQERIDPPADSIFGFLAKAIQSAAEEQVHGTKMRQLVTTQDSSDPVRLDDPRFRNKYSVTWNVSLRNGSRFRYTLDGCAWDTAERHECVGPLGGRHSIDAELYAPRLVTEADEAVVSVRASYFAQRGGNWTAMPLPLIDFTLPLCGSRDTTLQFLRRNWTMKMSPCQSRKGWQPLYDDSFELPRGLKTPAQAVLNAELRQAGTAFAYVQATMLGNWRGEDEEGREDEDGQQSGAARHHSGLAAVLLAAAVWLA